MRERNGISPLILCAVLFAAGVFLGAIGLQVLSSDEKAELVAYLEVFVRGLGAGGMEPNTIFKLSLMQNVKSALLIWIFGLAVIGAPFSCLVLVIRGFALGFSSSFLIKEVAKGGVSLFFAGILPHSLISVPLFVALCSMSISFSIALLRERPWAHGGLWLKIAVYSLRFFIAVLGFTVSSAIEAYVCPFLLAKAAGV